MSILDAWRDRRGQKWQERWDREHRWTRLANYNAERHRGLVHTPEYDAAMAEEQEAFDREHEREYGVESDGGPFPVTLGSA